MPKVTFCMLVFNGDFVLRECLRSILPYGEVVVAEGPVEYFHNLGYTTSTDNTNSILSELLGEESVIHGRWDEKDEMMKCISALVHPQTTHVFMVDSDEVFSKDAMENILSQLDDYDSVSLKPYTFFGGFEHILGGFEESFTWYRIQRWYPGATWNTHRPPTVLAPDGKPWREHRHWNCPERFHHYSYVWASQVKSKSEYYATRSDCIPDYFQNIWLRWVTGNNLTRKIIEDEYGGVHEWISSRRSSCRTRLFEGHHPQVIQGSMPRLKERFDKELALYQ